jgi:rRNA-processing protein FCF1
MPPRPVILDTNFLLIPFQFKINIFGELDYLIEESHYYVISSRTLNELERLGASVGKDGMAARLALKMIGAGKPRIEIVKNDLGVDDWIVDYSKEGRAIVCTNDAALRKRLKRFNVKMIVLKAKSRLGFV